MITPTSSTMAASDRSTYCTGDVDLDPPRRPVLAPPCSRRSSRVRRSPGSWPDSVTTLPEDAEVAEEPPQDDEDQHRAEASTAQFLCAVTGGDAAQQLAHDRSGVVRGAPECSIRTGTDGPVRGWRR